MAVTFNKIIYEIDKSYKSDDTKGRTKELINELSTEERKVILSILKKSNNPIDTDYGILIRKLVSVSGKDPIKHEKDAALSPLQKTLMTFWRAIKDLFHTRISDDKLLEEISQFSKDSALEKMNSIQLDLDKELDILKTYNFYEAIVNLDKSKNYELDLTQVFLKDSFDSIINEFIERLAIGTTYNNVTNKYISFSLASLIRKEIIPPTCNLFNPIPRDFTMKTLVKMVDDIGFTKLSIREQNMVRLFINEYNSITA
jgi:hypothetical protein